MISNTNKIQMYIHCGRCLNDFKKHKYPNKSMADISKFDIGWTKQGLQVWCQIHDCNIVHIDFQGIKHPANLTAIKEKIKQVKKIKQPKEEIKK